MRLIKTEIDGLIGAVNEFLGNNHADLRLYGSRVDDQRKGGDIDLLLLVNNPKVKSELLSKKHLLLARMKEFIGDQKIDLKIADVIELEQDAFLKLIYPQSVQLK
jgi:hypothetical protein